MIQLHPAPPQLVEHCRRVAPAASSATTTGELDLNELAALVKWLADRDAFAHHDEWVSMGMALKIEAGDAGLPLWELTHDATVTPDVAATKWASFASTARPGGVTINSWFKRAHDQGWKGRVRKSTKSQFGQVAALAAQAGADLHPQGNALLGETARLLASIYQDTLDRFIDSTRDHASRPLASNYPQLPTTGEVTEHPLYDLAQTAIERIVILSETPRSFRQDKVLDILGILDAVHAPTQEALYEYLKAHDCIISPGKHVAAVNGVQRKLAVERNISRGFITNAKTGAPDPQISENIIVFLREAGIRLRFDIWRDAMEIEKEGTFVQMTDYDLNELFMLARSVEFNFMVAKDFLRAGIETEARKCQHDPLKDAMDQLAAEWDGTPRLNTWLHHTTGTPADLYHQAVGRNLIGSMVRRARHPGCEQAETVVFISPTQGTGKSTLAKILALEPGWYTDSFKLDGSPQNYLPLLDGKWVVEWSELSGMAQKEVEHVKSFLTIHTDRYAKKYEAIARDHPRRCIFIGTSNDRRPLQDSSGNRRFLPVHVHGEVNTDWLRANVRQLIGEAAVAEAAGADFAIPRNVWSIAGEHQDEARTRSPVEDLCQAWFDRAGPYYIVASDLNRAIKLAGERGRYGQFMDKMGYINCYRHGVRVWAREGANVRLEPVQSTAGGAVEMRVTTREPGR